MFYDRAKIFVKGGDGGNGVTAFRREKYVPEGGPSGGDGGRGGDIIFVTDSGLKTLVDFRYKRHYRAERGQHGQGKNRHGKSGKDLILRVPPGTLVKEAETGNLIADLVEPGISVVVSRGGRGGRGNARFAGPNNKAPDFAEKGMPGEEHWLEIELKLLADVGLVGYPNAGKSTLISRVSAAKPKIADYPFTTLVPNLGVVSLDPGNSFVVADIPGLVEGAHEGVGLGHQFLRHIERTKVLVFVLDTAGSEGREPLNDFVVLQQELALYQPDLSGRSRVIAANKMDLPEAQDNLSRLVAEIGSEIEIFPVSAVTGEGLKPLLWRVAELLKEVEEYESTILEPREEIKITKAEPPVRFKIQRRKSGEFLVTGAEIEKHVRVTDFDNDNAVRRFQRIIKRMGLDDALRAEGIKDGDVVKILEKEFEWQG